MKRIWYILFILSNLAFSQQETKYSFRKYSIQDGLSSSFITAVVQDKSGLLWIGTMNGLNSFDGINFKIYRNNPDDSTSISGNEISALYLDSYNTLWIGTERNGLNRYVEENDVFISYQRNKPDSLLYGYGAIHGINQLDSNVLLIISDGNIVFHYLKTGKFININLVNKKGNIILWVGPKKVYVENGKIWLGTWDGGMFLTNPKIEIEDIFSTSNVLPDNSISSIYSEPTLPSIFVGSWSGGLFEINKKDKNVTVYSKKEVKDNSSIPFNRITAITKDVTGKLWIGSENEGLAVVDLKNQTPYFQSIRAEGKDYHAISNNSITSLMQDNAGNIWIGTKSGLNQYAPFRAKFTSYSANKNDVSALSNNDITCTFKDSRGNLWFGTWGGGLNKYNSNGSFTVYRNNPLKPNESLDDYIKSITEDKKGNLYIGTRNKGVFQFNLQTKEIKNIVSWQLIQEQVISMCFIDNNLLCFGTVDRGLFLINLSDDNPKVYKISNDFSYSIVLDIVCKNNGQCFFYQKHTGLNYFDINSMDTSDFVPKIKVVDNPIISKMHYNKLYVDKRNDIWMIGNVFLNKLLEDNVTLKTYPFIANCMFEDSKTNLWVGSKSGLKKYNPLDDSFKSYSTLDGLCDNDIRSIQEDNQHFLWIGTSRGLARFNPVTEVFENYDARDGLNELSFSKELTVKSDIGEMFFCSNNGIHYFFPDSFKNNEMKPVISLRNLYVKKKLVGIGERFNNQIILKKNISIAREVVLKHKNNDFAIEFALFDYTVPEKNSYSYRLVGLHEDWIETNEPFVAFSHLKGGSYLFQVKGINCCGNRSENIAQVKFIIKPPFWRTWWFIGLVILAILLFIVSWIRYRTYAIRKKNILLQKMVNDRTREIIEKNEELKVQNEQIEEQKTQLERLNSTKDKLFSIIAHDLKNPFNAISGFASLLIKNFDTYPNETKLELLQLIESSSNSAYELLQNLLNWSRSNLNVIQYKPEEFNIASLVQDVASYLEIIAREKEISLQIEPSNILVYADKDMVNTIMRNLLANSLKFTSHQGSIKVSFEDYLSNTIIKVMDTGIGIPEDKIHKLFSMEDNYSTAGTQGEKGTGLGLLLCKDFVEKNKGEIFVESEVGKGSVFTVILPQKKLNIP